MRNENFKYHHHSKLPTGSIEYMCKGIPNKT